MKSSPQTGVSPKQKRTKQLQFFLEKTLFAQYCFLMRQECYLAKRMLRKEKNWDCCHFKLCGFV